jgi:hypothetical protein
MGIATTDLKLDRRPTLSPLTLATLPSMLLIPLAPFTDREDRNRLSIGGLRPPLQQEDSDPALALRFSRRGIVVAGARRAEE